ncbi:DNA-3-methyladenine glycosylase I [Timonella sp. A28]|uniref:DNA-3-methyladenine glycosylase I n=1 Tax=Timonella sp. A28 TaxID=3442640 RepID=UPI003EBA960C
MSADTPTTIRTPWATTDPLLTEYYDNEWGMPVTDESGVFERLTLEAFQSGLSWLTILRKRPAFREVFADFHVDTVAAFNDSHVESLLHDSRIIRNRKKITATITNAKATINVREEGGLAQLVWSFQPDETPRPLTMDDIPAQSPESVALSKALKKRGFSFVGPTTAFALMEAIGIVDTHIMSSYRRGSSGIWPQ